MAGKVELTENAVALLKRWYSDGSQNGKPHAVNSMYTRGRGANVVGLAICQRRGWIKSHPDLKLNKGGWRHDITSAGRALLASRRDD